MTAKWIVIEGGEGTGKSTLAKALNEHLTSKGLKVLVTKEPGTPHCPLTMQLRNIMLNSQFEDEMTITARELVSQAIRSIHIEFINKVRKDYDVILQDRGLMSGVAYGEACGNTYEFIEQITRRITGSKKRLSDLVGELYDYTLFLECSPEIGLGRAGRAKQEFLAGDAMEMKGLGFHKSVQENFKEMMYQAIDFKGEGVLGQTINVENLTCEEVTEKAIALIDIVVGLKRKPRK